MRPFAYPSGLSAERKEGRKEREEAVNIRRTNWAGLRWVGRSDGRKADSESVKSRLKARGREREEGGGQVDVIREGERESREKRERLPMPALAKHAESKKCLGLLLSIFKT